MDYIPCHPCRISFIVVNYEKHSFHIINIIIITILNITNVGGITILYFTHQKKKALSAADACKSFSLSEVRAGGNNVRFVRRLKAGLIAYNAVEITQSF